MRESNLSRGPSWKVVELGLHPGWVIADLDHETTPVLDLLFFMWLHIGTTQWARSETRESFSARSLPSPFRSLPTSEHNTTFTPFYLRSPPALPRLAPLPSSSPLSHLQCTPLPPSPLLLPQSPSRRPHTWAAAAAAWMFLLRPGRVPLSSPSSTQRSERSPRSRDLPFHALRSVFERLLLALRIQVKIPLHDLPVHTLPPPTASYTVFHHNSILCSLETEAFFVIFRCTVFFPAFIHAFLSS